ncbi:hypothetical protein [Orbus mooreae]|uniref:hypothetical protein n=1 Tax=Orbus mooreae TaxID=3074107 RepID=UPI00370D7286
MSGNSVIIDSGDFHGRVYGTNVGLIDSSLNNKVVKLSASANVYFNGGTVSDSIVGVGASVTANNGLRGFDVFGEASGKVYMNGGKVNEDIVAVDMTVASYSDDNNDKTISKGNGSVFMTDGQVNGDIHGAFITALTPFKNNANMSGTGYIEVSGGQIGGNIYGFTIIGGPDGEANFTGSVSIFNDVTFSGELFGVNVIETPSGHYQLFSGNTLSMGAKPLELSRLGNFENYNFYLNSHNQSIVYNHDDTNSHTALIKVTTELVNTDTAGPNGKIANVSNIQLSGISGENIINKGQSLILLDVTGADLTQDSYSNEVKLNTMFNLPI